MRKNLKEKNVRRRMRKGWLDRIESGMGLQGAHV